MNFKWKPSIWSNTPEGSEIKRIYVYGLNGYPEGGRQELARWNDGYHEVRMVMLQDTHSGIIDTLKQFTSEIICPSCKRLTFPQDIFAVDYDWKPPNQKFGRKHWHFQCGHSNCKTRWCSRTGEKLDV